MFCSPKIRLLISGVKNDLEALLDGTAAPGQLKSVLRLCHASAQGSLARRGHAAHLASVHGITLSDLAYDCIGDLFARDSAGRYVALQSYFAAYDVASFSDEDAFFHLQRLVFTKVRNGVFRLYQELDPQLGKILHNIKHAVRAFGEFIEIERLGESCLAPARCETLEHLPPFEAADLACLLVREAAGTEFTPVLLSRIASILRHQEEHSRILPIVAMGLAIRQFHEHKRIPQAGESTSQIDETAIDAREVVRSACREIKAETTPQYVGKGKVRESDFNLYFEVIGTMLHMRFVEHDGADFQLSQQFLKRVPGMTLQEYRDNHRNRLEYLARLAQVRASEILSKE